MTNNQSLYSVSSERAIIGSILIEPEMYDSVAEIVSKDDFFTHEHTAVFSVFSSLVESGEPVDIVTVSERLQLEGELENIGGVGYLIDISANTPSASNALTYAQIVKDRSIARKLDIAAREISERARDRDGLNSQEMIDLAERSIANLSDIGGGDADFHSTKEAIIDAIDRIEVLFDGEEDVTGLSTGLSDLDEMTTGLQPTDLIILAGRPASGKSTLAMNIAEHAATTDDKPVVVFSLEMPVNQLMNRMLSSLGRIDQRRIRTGKFESEDWPKLALASCKIKDSTIMINDSPGLSPSEMRAKVRKVEREKGQIGLIVVDYLQLMQIKNFTEGRAAEVSEISRALKAIAKEMNCPVIALSQLNRSLENRPNKRPINSDLRESGSIEQDADIIMFVYRDEVYNPETPDKGVAEIIIGKQRNGETGTCRAAFLGCYARFEDLTSSVY